MKRKIFAAVALMAGLAMCSLAQAQDWSKGALVPPNGRPNPYNVDVTDLPKVIRAGKIEALNYPVTVTGILLPYHAVKNFLSADTSNPLRLLLEKFVASFSQFSSLDDVERWLGLHRYPKTEGQGVFEIPFQNGIRPIDRMGFTLMRTHLGTGFTISCAQCHSANLFGRRIIGLTNRFPRANSAFVRGLELQPFASATAFQWATGASDGETEMFRRSEAAMAFIGAKMPVQLGLDTSLAQVALSLAKRAHDDWASRRPGISRDEPLAHAVADSKPAVWWNLKYKDRWLSDGSVVSGNPILTNFLWNEVGRGSDLHAVAAWINRNTEAIKDLTTAVFSTQAPRWTDFFDPSTISLARAERGEKIFLQRCSRCHGVYKKAWDLPNADQLSPAERLRTVEVDYPSHTFVVNVGTDPNRALGMRSLVQLNHLKISKENGIVIEVQKGYVPPPLVGIWARWPYFHNNSVPSLCAVLTRSEDRPITYWARPARDPNRDFDRDCNGYPEGLRPHGASPADFYDTRREGMSNAGHDEGIFLKDGRELLTNRDKLDLIQFLQTL